MTYPAPIKFLIDNNILIEIKQCKNNKRIFTSRECPFCGYKSKRSNIFRYNSKLKVGKSYCCGASFKDISYLIENMKYIKWLKDKSDFNYGRFEKFGTVDLDDEFDLPF